MATASVWYLVVHRIGKELGNDAAALTIAFRDTNKLAAGFNTGGRMPYHFVIGEDGTTEQCIPLDRTGAHAMKWNSKSIGIACIGDFRLHEMPDAQKRALIDLCSMLRLLIAGVQIIGHTDLPESTTDPLKICPGKKLDMPTVRMLVASRTHELSAALVADVGLQLTA